MNTLTHQDLKPLPPPLEDPQRRARLLAALYAAQDQAGWLSPEAVQEVADSLHIPVGQVLSTASFYTMFRLEPKGRYHIQVCEGLSCYLVDGAETLLEHIARTLGIAPGQMTPDGKFTLEVVQCLASCGTAPAMRVNDELYEHMTPDRMDALLERLKGE